MREVKVGQIYKHFKNKYYIVLDIVNDCESNNKEKPNKIVIYQALYDKHLKWARPLENFASEVDHRKYPNIKQKYRFEEVDVASDTEQRPLRLITKSNQKPVTKKLTFSLVLSRKK